MSTAGISFGGLASGLDTKAIIAALLAVERRPITQLESRNKGFQTQKTLIGELETKLSALKTKADALRKATSLIDYQASVDTERFFTATAGTGATPGSYSIQVTSLAKAEVSTSLGRADKTTSLALTGDLVITAGAVSKSVAITAANDSLQGIADAINASEASELVSASVLNTGDPTNPYKLVLAARKTGADSAFSVTAANANAALTAFAAEVDGNEATQGSNATLTIDGIPITRSSNTISDAIPGVTLSLKGVHGTEPATRLTVSTDTTKTAEKIKAFVDAYNEVVDFIAEQSKVDDKGTAKSPLFGDSTLRTIRSTLRSIVGAEVASTGNPAYSMLSQVGVTTDTAGKLTFDESKFTAALNADEDAVRVLFADPTVGIAGRVWTRIDEVTDSVDGLFKSRRDSIDSRIRQNTDQIARAERRLDLYEQSLVERFARLEQLLGRLQNQGGALGSLAALGAR
jgi:flagellar hook-associated protein 2